MNRPIHTAVSSNALGGIVNGLTRFVAYLGAHGDEFLIDEEATNGSGESIQNTAKNVDKQSGINVDIGYVNNDRVLATETVSQRDVVQDTYLSPLHVSTPSREHYPTLPRSIFVPDTYSSPIDAFDNNDDSRLFANTTSESFASAYSIATHCGEDIHDTEEAYNAMEIIRNAEDIVATTPSSPLHSNHLHPQVNYNSGVGVKPPGALSWETNVLRASSVKSPTSLVSRIIGHSVLFIEAVRNRFEYDKCVYFTHQVLID
jgi:hypothetical protein